MEEQILQYFTNEKIAAMCMVCLGALGFFFALILLRFSIKKWLIGFSYPLSIASLLQLIMGAFILLSKSGHAQELQLMYLGTPDTFFTYELERMEKAIQGMEVYAYLEIGFLVLGVILCLVAIKIRGFVFGVGLGLFLSAAVMLTFDYYAEKRTEQYYHTLLENTTLEE